MSVRLVNKDQNERLFQGDIINCSTSFRFEL